jgi:hypothetical protein
MIKIKQINDIASSELCCCETAKGVVWYLHVIAVELATGHLHQTECTFQVQKLVGTLTRDNRVGD